MGIDVNVFLGLPAGLIGDSRFVSDLASLLVIPRQEGGVIRLEARRIRGSATQTF